MTGTRVGVMLCGLVALALAACGTADPVPADAGPGAAVRGIDTEGQEARDLYLQVVLGLQNEGRWNASLAYLDDYDLRYPGDPSSQVLRADALAATGDTAAAETLYRGLLETRFAPAAHAGLGQLRALAGDWPGAVAGYANAVALRPSNARFLNNLGYAQLRAGRHEEALSTLSRAFELDQGRDGIRNNYAIALHLTGHRAAYDQLIRSIEDTAEREAVANLVENWPGNQS